MSVSDHLISLRINEMSLQLEFNHLMKKQLSCLPHLKAHSCSDELKKEDNSSYFQLLERKLLLDSDKLTSLMEKPSMASDTRSNYELGSRPSISQLLPAYQETPHTPNPAPYTQKQVTSSSILLQKIMQVKKSQLVSSKSQYFPQNKEKEQQMQRKLTYNLVRQPEETTSQHSFNIIQDGKECSTSKSDKINDHLKKSSSTASSAALKTIDRIKKIHSQIHSLGDKVSQISPSISKMKGPSIDDFQILKYLEEGQFGAVYLAFHKKINFICALKKIPKKIFEGQARFINQLVRQIKIQSFLDHPNIVQLYTFFSDQDHLYLILEPCCGGNVYASLRKDSRFGEEKVRKIVKQVSHAVQFMHDQDIIHRDIKPQNILLHENIVKVCDFGWSIHSPLLRDTRCGTPLYSSPEVVQKQQYDNKVDVWNIGIFTFELMYGRVPFEIRTEDDLVKVVDEDIYFPKGMLISKNSKDFIMECLHKNPKDRVTMTKLVDHPWIQN